MISPGAVTPYPVSIQVGNLQTFWGQRRLFWLKKPWDDEAFFFQFHKTMVYILAAKRTPIGSFLGQLKDLSAPDLGASLVTPVLEEAGLKPTQVEALYMGQVLTAGSGQAPARQVAIKGGLPSSVITATVNKVCGSGLKAVSMAADQIRLGVVSVALAGGQESMSQAPYLLSQTRFGWRLGHQTAVDHLIKDGLWDVYNQLHMGQIAERCVRDHQVSRSQQDEYAILSYRRALEAQEKGYFQSEIQPISVGGSVVSADEEPSRVIWDKIPRLKPVFEAQGTITAANASKINDGAALVALASDEFVKNQGLKPLARVVAYGEVAQDPLLFPTAPIGAIRKVLAQAQWTVDQVDLFEVNEAFAVVALVTAQALNIPLDKLNVHGGAIALGHPIGCSGARILTTLVHALKTRGLRRGVASLCIGGGEAIAMAIELEP